jgi:hypothetical protein
MYSKCGAQIVIKIAFEPKFEWKNMAKYVSIFFLKFGKNKFH